MFVASIALLTGWTLMSAIWSIEPAQSVLDARRDLVYVAVALAVVAAPQLLAVAIGPAVLAAVDVVVVVGIVRYLVSGPVDPAEGALLSWPVGYANAFAALCVIALPIALALAAHDARRLVRAAGAASVPLFVAVIVLASSRGGVLAAAVAVVVLMALDPRRRALAVTVARVGVPALAVCRAVCTWADLGAHAAHSARSGAVAVARGRRRDSRLPRRAAPAPGFSCRGRAPAELHRRGSPLRARRCRRRLGLAGAVGDARRRL